MNLFARTAAPQPNVPRYYQDEATTAITAAFGTHRSALLVMATGLGKTVTFTSLIAAWPGKVLVLVHRKELLDQARADIEKTTGEWVEVEQGQYHAALTTRIVVASVQTIYQPHRLERFGKDHFTLVVIDEAHHYIAPSFKKPVDFFESAKVLGVTATPDRADSLAMGQVFECCPYTMDIEDGIEAGFLVPIVGRRVFLDEIDLTEVKTSQGDLQIGQLDEAIKKAVEGIVIKTLELGGDRRGICFFPGVASARLAAETFNRYRPGSACFLSGDTNKEEGDGTRDAIVRAFKRGEYQYLCNCNIATEGFDAPDVSLIVQGRPTKSRSLYAQMTGRGTRVLRGIVEAILGREGAAARRAAVAASAKPDMLILDFVGNAGKHSLCTVEDVLGGKYDDKEIELAKRKSGTGQVNTRDALQSARAEIKAMAAATKAAKVKARVEDFNPFGVLGIKDPGGAAYDAQYGHTPPTQDQFARLDKFGYKPDDLKGMNKRACDKLIAESIKRMRGGLCSYKQLRQFQRHGITDRNITMARAKEAMQYLADNGWGNSSAFDPKRLKQIVHTRISGEEG